MGTKSRPSQSSAPSTAPVATSESSPGISVPEVAQPAGNAAVQERLGLAERAAGDSGTIASWGMEKIKGWMGIETDVPEADFELLHQTAKNTASAAKKLQEAAVLARDMGYHDLAKDLGAAGARLGKLDGLATDLGKVVEVKRDLDLLKRFIQATEAMLAVDMRSAEAGPVFDEFFAVAGEMGGEMLKFGGMWGEILAPYATFVQKLGESGFFAKMKENLAMQGTKNAVNIYALENAETDR